MKQYALIGHPLGHSLSPQIHERLFALEGLEAAYRLDDFPPEELEERLPVLRSYAAFNVTIPYKRAILPHLAAVSESAALYGAVNAVLVGPDGRMTGDNTDCAGFLRTMQSHGFPLETEVCVVGAGGVGRMFALESARQGGRVTLAVRQSGLGKARAVAAEAREKLGAELSVRELDALEGRFGLVINATPVGMFPNVSESPLPQSFLEGVDAVFDCVYNPSETLLLRQARALGKPAVGGMEMLVWQAAAAHESWHGTRFSAGAMGQLVREMEKLLELKERAT